MIERIRSASKPPLNSFQSCSRRIMNLLGVEASMGFDRTADDRSTRRRRHTLNRLRDVKERHERLNHSSRQSLRTMNSKPIDHGERPHAAELTTNDSYLKP